MSDEWRRGDAPQRSFFDEDTVGGFTSDALVSPCGLYRYWLTRTWDQSRPPACFVMLNPSTADAERDDPTVRRCVGFAKRWGWGGLAVVNLFAFRATSPKDLKRAQEPVGPDNDRHLLEFARRAGVAVAAWGAHGAHLGRAREVVALLRGAGVALHCLGTTADGSPRHPLYVRADRALTPFGEAKRD